MTATPERIGFITQEFRKAVATSAAAQTRHGALARQTDDPVPTFFDSADDAQIVADARQAIMSADRRLFRVDTDGVEEAFGLEFLAGTMPVARYIDSERDADIRTVVSAVVVDLGRGTASFTLWG